ncbi:hypothetical protein FRC12_005636 [Ceratobasidium sp. 428]|nr:hypothetical protein FRC12_005636 [Ceratobasidium sp. 428]
MFALPRHPHASHYQSLYSPYEQLLLEQEMERRRRAEAYRCRPLEIEQLNRRRQYEHARRQAELQRQRQVEMEMERGTTYQRANERRRSLADRGVEDLLSMLYGSRASSALTRDASPFCDRGASSGPLVRSDVTSTATEDSTPASQDTSLPAGSAEPRDASPTGLPSETEAVVSETQETQKPCTAGSLAAVGGIVAMFASLRSSFTFPSRLDFVSPSSCDSPKLAYTPNNAPLHQYEHVLTGLLTQLDAVESYGDEGVRKARKEAVKQIEGELAGLDERKIDEWREHYAPKQGANTICDASITDVDAATIPLPDDADDDEKMDSAGSELPTDSLSPSVFVSSRIPTPLEGSGIEQTSLDVASSSSDCDSEEGNYVDVDIDAISGTEMEESEEAEVERERDLAEMDGWELDF